MAPPLVAGVDLWLNLPRPPLEASGTSGMKVVLNGGLNFSVADGWWEEAYDGTNGWNIVTPPGDAHMQDEHDADVLLRVLQDEIVPLFYERGSDELPREWIRRMKNAMKTVCPVFSAYRMVREYTERLYLPAGQAWDVLSAKGLERARALAAWRERGRAHWKEVAVRSVEADMVTPLEAGATRLVRAEVTLGSLAPKDVSIALYAGLLSGEGQITSASVTEMKVEGSPRTGVHVYSGMLHGITTGLQGFRIRILPSHEDLGNPLLMNCITWG
jgi:starch phosphorylase